MAWLLEHSIIAREHRHSNLTASEEVCFIGWMTDISPLSYYLSLIACIANYIAY